MIEVFCKIKNLLHYLNCNIKSEFLKSYSNLIIHMIFYFTADSIPWFLNVPLIFFSVLYLILLKLESFNHCVIYPRERASPPSFSTNSAREKSVGNSGPPLLSLIIDSFKIKEYETKIIWVQFMESVNLFLHFNFPFTHMLFCGIEVVEARMVLKITLSDIEVFSL